MGTPLSSSPILSSVSSPLTIANKLHWSLCPFHAHHSHHHHLHGAPGRQEDRIVSLALQCLGRLGQLELVREHRSREGDGLPRTVLGPQPTDRERRNGWTLRTLHKWDLAVCVALWGGRRGDSSLDCPPPPPHSLTFAPYPRILWSQDQRWEKVEGGCPRERCYS